MTLYLPGWAHFLKKLHTNTGGTSFIHERSWLRKDGQQWGYEDRKCQVMQCLHVYDLATSMRNVDSTEKRKYLRNEQDRVPAALSWRCHDVYGVVLAFKFPGPSDVCLGCPRDFYYVTLFDRLIA